MLCDLTFYCLFQKSHVVSDLIYSNHKCNYRQKKNELSTGSIIMTQNPIRHVIIYFTTESTKVSCIQGVNGIRLTLNSALFICLLLFAIPKAIGLS